MFSSDIERCVHDAVNSVRFEKVADLSKEQFEQILSEAICSVLNSDSFAEQTSNSQAMLIKRRR